MTVSESNANPLPPEQAPSDRPDGSLGALAAEHERMLAELGAESRAERQAKRVVPWIASITLHGMLILIGFLVTWSVVTMRENEPVLVIADFDTLIFDPVAVLDLDHAIEEQAIDAELDLLPLDQPFDEPLPTFESDVLAPAPDAMLGSAPVDFAPAPARGSASFMGLTTTNAQKIVYIIDASGAMVPYLQFIVHHLKQSLDPLSPEQSFAIIFYQGGEATMVPAGDRGLTAATAQAKDRALRWVEANVRPRLVSDPTPAFEMALRLNPDAVFVLSANITAAGRWEVDQEDLLNALENLNPVDRVAGHRRTQINCIQFLDPDPLETMRLIADRHGGERSYRFVSRRDLGIHH